MPVSTGAYLPVRIRSNIAFSHSQKALRFTGLAIGPRGRPSGSCGSSSSAAAFAFRSMSFR